MSEDHSDEETGLIFVFGSLVLCCLLVALPGWFRALPYSCAVLLLAIIIYIPLTLIEDQDNPKPRLSLSGDLIQALFLPPLLFTDLFKGSFHNFYTLLSQSLLLAFPATLIQIGLIAPAAHYAFENIFSESWPWDVSIAFAGMAAPTDPIAAIAVLSSLGASEKLIGVISGESILNDGVGVLVVNVALKYVEGNTYSVGEFIGIIAAESIGALAFGFGAGLVTVLMLYLIQHNVDALVCMTMAAPYLAFTTCLYALEISGVLAVVMQALVVNYLGKTLIQGKAAERMEQFWEQLEFIGVTLLFFYSGSQIVGSVAGGHITASAWTALPVVYVFAMVARTLAVVMLYPLMKRLGPGCTLREALVVSWAGLRGGVGLALGLTIAANSEIETSTGAHALFFMSGLVLLTLTINANTVAPLIKYFGLIVHANPHLVRFHKERMYEEAQTLLGAAGVMEDEKFREGHDLPKVGSLIKKVSTESRMLSERESIVEGLTLANSEMTDANFLQLEIGEDSFAVHRETMKKKRAALLLTQRVTYDWLLVHGLITKAVWLVLNQTVDLKYDQCDDPVQDQWDVMHDRVLSARCGFSPIKLLLHRDVSNPASLAFAFIYSHLKGIQAVEAAFHQHKAFAEVKALKAESAIAIQAPLKELERIRITDPDALQLMKYRQLKGSLGFLLNHYVENLHESGVINEPQERELAVFIHQMLHTINKDNVPVSGKPFEDAEMLLHHPDVYPFELTDDNMVATADADLRVSASQHFAQVRPSQRSSAAVQQMIADDKLISHTRETLFGVTQSTQRPSAMNSHDSIS